MAYSIEQLQMVNVVVALKVWGQCWANRRLQIFCDNKAVVDVLSFGRAKESILATCARNVWLLIAHWNISLVVSHVQDQENTMTDLLSRWSGTLEESAKLQELVPGMLCWVSPHIDLLLLNNDL